MLFSSFEFIYLFLPPVLLVFLILRKQRMEGAVIWWLILASLFFYAWWNPKYLLLIMGSMLLNYALHLVLLKQRSIALLTFGVATNLLVLCVFKYADFLLQNVAWMVGVQIDTLGIILPLAISFFTFQQISFLVDTHKGEVQRTDLKRYVLFVTFFPQLIAGPIIRHRDTIPQFNFSAKDKAISLNFAIGATLFAVGLFKKLVLADGIAPVANSVFNGVEAGALVSTTEAWLGALAYTFQLYFDFSGYCDMALGLARMFGIKLPINFNSPYKARSISEFWRRWHITLSRFLRDYLYIPLGGNRSGVFGSSGNLAITMVLGGLWHGAGWTFIIWGGMHGAFLIINHTWRRMIAPLRQRLQLPQMLTGLTSWIVTLVAVVIAWVFFRAESVTTAVSMIQAMFFVLPVPEYKQIEPLVSDQAFACFAIAVLFILVTCCPNSIELTRRYRPVLETYKELSLNEWRNQLLVWRPTGPVAVAVGGVMIVSLVQMYRLNELTEFLYFNF